MPLGNFFAASLADDGHHCRLDRRRFACGQTPDGGGARKKHIRDCGVEGGGQMPYTMAVRAAIDAQAMRAKAERFWFLPASS
jgi:hypothetical protein